MTNTRKKIIAITGGTGFVGALIVKYHLKNDDEVRVLTRRKSDSKPNINWFIGDILDVSYDFSDFLNGVDILYHCAGEMHDERKMKLLHVDGTRRLLDASIGRVKRWVQLSSVGAYGACGDATINEKYCEQPVGVYECTKGESDRLVQDISIRNGMEYVILRPSIIFGDNMPNNSLLQMLNLIKKRLFFYVNCDANLNYVHVEDVVRAIVLCGKSMNAIGKTYILSDVILLKSMVSSLSRGIGINPTNLKIPEFLVRKIVRIFGKIPKFPLTEKRLNALTNTCKYDSFKIQKELRFSFKEGLDIRFEQYAEKSCK